jgi:flagellar biosynthetic protein FliQ
MELPFAQILGECFLMVLMVSGIPLLVASAGGLCVSILQTATQLQEQSVGFIVKFLLVAIVFFLGAGWFWARLLAFLGVTLGAIASLGTV